MAKKGTLFGKPRSEVIKHPGAFSAKAARAGKSTAAYARQVTKPGSKASTETRKQAGLAKAFATMRRIRSGKAKFLVPLVLAALASSAMAANLTCPSGYFTPSAGQTTTGPSVNTLLARGAPAVVFQAYASGTVTIAVEICCSPLDCTVATNWAPIQSGSLNPATTPGSAVASVQNPTCLYRVNTTACTGCNVVAVFSCAGA